jgi:O-antigen/teichoic acid export membrane protein/aminoglycoside phosphotransferase (APT) family kinase protein
VRTHSTIYIAHCVDRPQERLVVKLPVGTLRPNLDIAEIERERDALRLARTVFGPDNPHFGAPRVCAFSPQGWLALEFIDGEPFTTVLAGAEHSDQAALMGKLGQWLRTLHEGAEYDESATLDTREYLSRLIESKPGSLPPFITRSLDALRADPSFFGQVNMPAALAHGDAKLENFLVDTKGKIWGIDIQLTQRGSVSFDLSGILNRFEIWTASRAGRHLKAERAGLSDALLNGYGWESDAPYRSTLRKLQLASASGIVDDWVAARQAGARWSPTRQIESLRYQGLIKSLLARDMQPGARSMSGARRGLFFLFAESNFGLITQMIGLAIVARILTPEQNGTYQVGAALAAIASTFRDFGVAEYLIQKNKVDRDDFKRAFTVNVMTSWSMFALLALTSPLVAKFYGNPELVPIMLILSINFLLIPFGAVTMAWHRRNMNFEPVFWSGVIANSVTFVVCIACVFAGLGALSLAWSSLAGVVATVAVAIYFRVPQSQHRFLFSGLREAIGFGKHVVGIYVVGQLGKSAPELIIGRLLSLSAVAFFSRGGSLLEIFSRLVTRVVAPVCLPYFTSALREEGRLVAPYVKSVSYMTYIGWPFLLFTGVYSAELIRVLYGPQWGQSALVAKLICLAGAIEITHVYAKEALIAVGRPDRGNWLQIANQLTRVIGIVAGAQFGLMGVGVGLVVAALVGVAQSQHEVRKFAAVTVSDLWHATRPAFVMLGVMALLIGACDALLSRLLVPILTDVVGRLTTLADAERQTTARLLTAVVVGMVFIIGYAGVALLQKHPVAMDAQNVWRRLRRSKSHP